MKDLQEKSQYCSVRSEVRCYSENYLHPIPSDCTLLNTCTHVFVYQDLITFERQTSGTLEQINKTELDNGLGSPADAEGPIQMVCEAE